MNSYAIGVDTSGPVPRFRLARNGEPGQRVLFVCIQDSSHEDIWVLTAPSFTVSRHSAIAHPIPDRPSDGTGITESEKRYLDAVRASGIWLEDMVYGEVPNGLIQAIPVVGPAPTLSPGESYVIMTNGTEVALREFTA